MICIFLFKVVLSKKYKIKYTYKAFDSIDRSQVLKLVKGCGVDKAGVRILDNLFENMTLQFKGKYLKALH